MSKIKSRKTENLRDVDRTLIQAVMFKAGIIPMETPELDMNRALKQLSPEESRKFKRKFRKLWRKAMRNFIKNGKSRETRENSIKQKLGVGKTIISRHESNERKILVSDFLWKEISSLIERFDQIKTGNKS